MSQAEKARRFRALHIPGDPLVLYNIWDAASAQAVCAAGAPAIATGSWSLAGAQGYRDGQAIPLDLLEMIVRRIAASVDAPLTVDAEGGYGEPPDTVADTAERLIAAGAIGLNFEDQIVGGEGLHDTARQAERIRAIRARAEALAIPVVINARTDVFLKTPRADHAGVAAEAKARAAAYADAGADCVFLPGLVSEAVIAEMAAAAPAPINVMVMDGAPPIARLAELGVARVSHGPGPFRAMLAWLQSAAAEVYAA